MHGKLLMVLGLVAIAVLVLSLTMVLVTVFAPGVAGSIGLLAPYWWTWYLVDVLAYVISMLVLILAGASISRFIERRVPVGIDHLRASMFSTSAGVLSAFVMVFTLVAYVVGTELATSLLVVAFLFAIIPSFISWLLAPLIINAAYRCRHDPTLQRIVDRVAARAGMKPPKAMVADMPLPNAFAYSSPLMGRYVAVTTGLLRMTHSDNELEAIIGHELGHHKHHDNAVIMLFGIIPTAVYFLGRFLLFAGLLSRYTDGGERRSGSGRVAILAALGVLLIAISILLQLAVLGLSRLREYYADAHGAKVTSPYSMINALKLLDMFYRSARAKAVISSSGLKPLFIYAFTEPFIGLEELLSTHPPIYKRISFLETLIGQEIKA